MEKSFVGWFTVTRHGSDRARWLEMLGKAGVEVRDEDSPVWSDIAPRKPRNDSVTFDQFPMLPRAIAGLRVLKATGFEPVLVVPNFAHFAAPDIWREVWRRIEDIGAGFVLCAETVTEVRDMDAGLVLMKARRGRTMSEKKAAARLATGRPTIRMAPGKKAERRCAVAGEALGKTDTGYRAASVALFTAIWPAARAGMMLMSGTCELTDLSVK